MNFQKTSTTSDDPWIDAHEAKERPRERHYFGQVLTDAFHCALVKGEGIVPFDPTKHFRRNVSITISLTPLASSGLRYDEVRKMVDFDHEWLKVTKPSLEALGTSGRGVNGKWVHVELVAAGRYDDRCTGEEKESTAFRFHAVYETQDECEDAAAAHFGRSRRQSSNRGRDGKPLS